MYNYFLESRYLFLVKYHFYQTIVFYPNLYLLNIDKYENVLQKLYCIKIAMKKQWI